MTNDNHYPITPTLSVFAGYGNTTALAGVTFRHKKGQGFYLILKGVRTAVSPPKVPP